MALDKLLYIVSKFVFDADASEVRLLHSNPPLFPLERDAVDLQQR